MITVWEGSICRDSQALQLLLIIDYIFDWARDIYRPLILNQLSALSTEEVLYTDTDIFSTIEGRELTSINESQELQSQVNEGLLEHSLSDNCPWDLILAPHGVIRDASVIETKLMGLVITEDDIEMFLLSFPSEEAANSALCLILSGLKDSWHVTGEILVALEAEWAEDSMEGPLNVNPDEHFYLKITVQMYVGVEWEPVRQLTYLSVSECAIAKFADRVAFKMDGYTQTGNTAVTESKIIGHLRQIKQQSVFDNLRAVISMVSFTNTITSQRKNPRMKRHLRILGWKNDDSHTLVNAVAAIHESHKIGRRQPTDKYLRFVCNRVQQTIRVSNTRLWPSLVPIQLDQNGCILVDGININVNIPKRCLYIVRGTYEMERAPLLVESAFQRGLYYKTIQLGPGMRPDSCFNVLNESTAPNEYWMDKNLSGEAINWLEAIRQQMRTRGTSAPHEMSPITISSDEEASQTDSSMEID